MRTYRNNRSIKLSIIRLLEKYNNDFNISKYDKKYVETLVNGFYGESEFFDTAEQDAVALVKGWWMSHFNLQRTTYIHKLDSSQNLKLVCSYIFLLRFSLEIFEHRVKGDDKRIGSFNGHFKVAWNQKCAK